MTNNVFSHGSATLVMPFPRLSEGRFSSCTALTDDALFDATGVRIAFSRREGGVSAAPYDALNLGSHVGDDIEAVLENRRRLLEGIGAAGAPCIVANQVHGDAVVTCERREDALSCQQAADEGADAVLVRDADTAAMLCFADCVPVIAVAPTGAFAVIHAGWRGVMARIAEKAVRMLCSAEGVDASSVNVYIGPHIRSCHFEVGEDLASRFAAAFGDRVVVRGRFVDMAAALASGLVSCGVDPRRIADAQACTVCDGGRHYYSYRNSGGVCGRHAAVAFRVSQGERSATHVA